MKTSFRDRIASLYKVILCPPGLQYDSKRKITKHRGGYDEPFAATTVPRSDCIVIQNNLILAFSEYPGN